MLLLQASREQPCLRLAPYKVNSDVHTHTQAAMHTHMNNVYTLRAAVPRAPVV